MLNRWLGILTAAGMLLANGALFVRDILPHWLPNNTPATDAQTLAPRQERNAQVGVFDAAGHELGRSWTRATRATQGDTVTVHTTTVIKTLPLPAGVTVPQIRTETELSYHADRANIDELHFKLHGLGLPIALDGECYETGELACQWRAGPQHGNFVLEAASTAAFGDVIRPFDRLPGLYVGQRWRLKLLDPLKQVVPGLKESGFDLEAAEIRVTRTENIEHRGETVEAFVVEGAGATAWVAPDGRVLRQEVTLPLLGKLVLLDEPYDQAARESAIASIRPDSDK